MPTVDFPANQASGTIGLAFGLLFGFAFWLCFLSAFVWDCLTIATLVPVLRVAKAEGTAISGSLAARCG